MPPTLAARPGVPSTAPRTDVYVEIHKALRHCMADTLVRVGRLDVLDDDDMARTLVQLGDMLTFCASHVKQEDAILHAAIEARRPTASSRTADDHEEHLEAIAVLRNQAFALKAATPATRTALALRLYRHLARFVADQLQHMHVEETENNATLWALCADGELQALHERLSASLGPAEQAVVVRWLVPALAPAERARLLGAMQAALPFDAFAAVLEGVRPHMDATGWSKLMRALGFAAPVKYA